MIGQEEGRLRPRLQWAWGVHKAWHLLFSFKFFIRKDCKKKKKIHTSTQALMLKEQGFGNGPSTICGNKPSLVLTACSQKQGFWGSWFSRHFFFYPLIMRWVCLLGNWGLGYNFNLFWEATHKKRESGSSLFLPNHKSLSYFFPIEVFSNYICYNHTSHSVDE